MKKLLNKITKVSKLILKYLYLVTLWVDYYTNIILTSYFISLSIIVEIRYILYNTIINNIRSIYLKLTISRIKDLNLIILKFLKENFTNIEFIKYFTKLYIYKTIVIN